MILTLYRKVVRLGEHDIRTTDDGAHLDISPDRVESHENWNATLMISDIAVVYFKDDIEFNGRLSYGNNLLIHRFEFV